LGIALLHLFFSYMSIFQWRDLLTTSLGKAVLLSIGSLWIFRTIAEIMLFKIGVDGAWWRVFLFGALAFVYMIPLVSAIRMGPEQWKAWRGIGTNS
jgi:hypothetical protein